MATPLNFNNIDRVARAKNTARTAVRTKESNNEIRDRLDAEHIELIVNGTFDRLLEFSDKAGLNRADEISANRERMLLSVKEIRAKYPGKSNLILGAFSRLISETICYLSGTSAFDLELSSIVEANRTVRYLLEKNTAPAGFVAGIIVCQEKLRSYDAREAFCEKYGVELDIFPWEMTERERAQIAENGIIAPPEKDDPQTRRSNNILVGDVDGILARYPSQMHPRFPRRIAVGRYVTGETYAVSDPKERSMFSGVTGGVMDHELFHWFKGSDASVALETNAAWWVTAGLLNEEQIKASATGYVWDYGKTNWHEDQATVAQMLYTSSAAVLQQRLVADPRLKKKVELITGCEYDVERGLFTKLFSKSEMGKRFGISERLFYARWSYYDGKVLMNAEYWNNILKGNQNGAD